jgi:hypothetical protein
MRPDELPALPREEGVSLRDVGEGFAGALAAVALVFFLVETIGWQGWLALPPLVWLHWRRHPDPRDFGPRVTGAPGVPETYWLEDAYRSRQRGTGISTLAVRYDVDPDWLESELSRFAPTPRV